MSVDISRSLDIDGWMSEKELMWLAEQASHHRSIVELGSYCGRSTLALAQHALGVVYAIDDWRGPRAPVDAWWEHGTPSKFKAALFDKFSANLSEFIQSGKVQVIRSNHRDLPNNMPVPDMVFIDGDHAKDSVKSDISFWRERMKYGGLLCGHDIGQEQIAEAVREMLGQTDLPADSIWSKTI